MDVIFSRIRQFVIDHEGQLFNIESARGDIGGDHYLHGPVLEFLQRLHAFTLGAVAVNGGCRHAVALQFAHQAVGVAFGTDENQHLLHIAAFDQVGQQGALVFGVDLEHPVGDQIGRRIAARDFDRHRRAQHLVGEALDVFREGSRKQQALAFSRQQREDAFDIGHEAHVEHAIGLIKHQNLDARQIDRFLLHVVEQTARGGNEDFDAGAQGLDLRIDVHTAKHHRRTQAHIFCVGADVFLDLCGKLAGRRQHQGADRMARRRRAGALLGGQQLQNRQGEAGGFSGTGLSTGHHVMSGEDGRDGLELNGCRLGVTLIGNCAQQLGKQPERLKRH